MVQPPPRAALAVRVAASGPTSGLRRCRVHRPSAGRGEVLVEVRSAAVNRSDVLGVRGVLPTMTYPRVPGRDFAGVVVEGPSELVGTEVWGTGGGDLGFTRDGSHAQFVVVPADAVVPLPAGLPLVEAGACGLAYFVADEALRRAGGVAGGDTALVTGAVGGVGTAAAALARWRGAAVIGAVRGAEEAKAAEAAGIDVVVDTEREDLATAVRSATDGRGADTAVDTVGGAVLNATVHALGIGGGACFISSPPSTSAEFDLLTFYQRDLRLVGLNSGRFTAQDAAARLRALLPGFESGALTAPPIAAHYPLDDAAAAYRDVEEGTVTGRVLILPGS
jgi:NADPH2:quinone reductase